MKLVKVGHQMGVIGARIKEYAVGDEAFSVQAALNMAGFTVANDEEVIVNESIKIDIPYTSYLLKNGDMVLVIKKRAETLKIKVGRVGQRLQEVSSFANKKASAFLAQAGLYRENDERLFLKKESDSYYDEDITALEYAYTPVAGDILVLEKEKVTDPKITYVIELIEYLCSEDVLEITDEEEMKNIVKNYMTTHKL